MWHEITKSILLTNIVPISDYILEICKQTFDRIINDSGHRLYSPVQQRGPHNTLLGAPGAFRFRNARRKDAWIVLSLDHLLIIYNVLYYYYFIRIIYYYILTYLSILKICNSACKLQYIFIINYLSIYRL